MFGGIDEKDVWRKLDELQELGVTVLYLNPIFRARTNHRSGDSRRRDRPLPRRRNLCRGVSGTVAACGTGHCRRGFHGAERIGEQHDEGRAREGRGAFPKPARLPLFGRGPQPEKPRKPRVAEKNRGVGAFFSRRKLDK